MIEFGEELDLGIGAFVWTAIRDEQLFSNVLHLLYLIARPLMLHRERLFLFELFDSYDVSPLEVKVSCCLRRYSAIGCIDNALLELRYYLRVYEPQFAFGRFIVV